MKKFIFELQTLYEIKKREENFEKKQMRKIEEKLHELSAKLEMLYFELENTNSSLTKEIGNSIKAHNLNHYNNYLKKIFVQTANQKNKIEAENKKKTECMLKLLEIHKELKSLDNLKQKKYEEYLKEEKREQEKIIEDIMSFKVAAS